MRREIRRTARAPAQPCQCLCTMHRRRMRRQAAFGYAATHNPPKNKKARFAATIYSTAIICHEPCRLQLVIPHKSARDASLDAESMSAAKDDRHYLQMSIELISGSNSCDILTLFLIDIPIDNSFRKER